MHRVKSFRDVSASTNQPTNQIPHTEITISEVLPASFAHAHLLHKREL